MPLFCSSSGLLLVRIRHTFLLELQLRFAGFAYLQSSKWKIYEAGPPNRHTHRSDTDISSLAEDKVYLSYQACFSAFLRACTYGP